METKQIVFEKKDENDFLSKIQNVFTQIHDNNQPQQNQNNQYLPQQSQNLYQLQQQYQNNQYQPQQNLNNLCQFQQNLNNLYQFQQQYQQNQDYELYQQYQLFQQYQLYQQPQQFQVDQQPQQNSPLMGQIPQIIENNITNFESDAIKALKKDIDESTEELESLKRQKGPSQKCQNDMYNLMNRYSGMSEGEKKLKR